jgi:hypothetical protein
MMERRLRSRLGGLELKFRQALLWRRLTICWLVALGFALALLVIRSLAGWTSPGFWFALLAGGIIAAGFVRSKWKRIPPDYRSLVTAIEREHPEMRHLLSAAFEQEPNPDSGQFGFLQLRVIDEVLAHPRGILWERNLDRRLSSARLKHSLALIGFIVVSSLTVGPIHWQFSGKPAIAGEIQVSPGDTQLERGTGLVVSARFGRRPPVDVALVLTTASGKTKRIPLERHLADPVFGASLPEISEDGRYRVEYGQKSTREYKITVFDYPALEHADAFLRFPEYTGLTNKTVRDTRRVSAVEGTRLTYTLQLNKPVARARLLGKEQTLNLLVQSNAVAMLNDWTVTNSGRYSLELVDAEGRTNKFPTDFAIQALTNRRPEIKIAFPRGDQRTSRLEELQLQAEASDDFGLLKYGIGYGIAGDDPKIVELGGTAASGQKRQFGYLIALEKLGVEVDQLVSYFAWAEDYGPDGQVRRTYSDMFFAEIRPFEEVFRPDQSGGENGDQNGNQGQGGNQSVRLAELQKQIVIATWKLQREKEAVNARRP